MAPLNLPWKRLVRYSSSSDRAVKYGEPIAALDTDITKLAQEGKLQVQQFVGTDPLHLEKTDLVEDVARLYGPLEPKDVPIIRCIGLNYKSHSKCEYNFIELCSGVPNFPSSSRDWQAPAHLPYRLYKTRSCSGRPRLTCAYP